VIIALNQIDHIEKRGISIDARKLCEILGVPVIPTAAVKGLGIHELTEEIVSPVKEGILSHEVKYSSKAEERIEKLSSMRSLRGPRRFCPIRILSPTRSTRSHSIQSSDTWQSQEW